MTGAYFIDMQVPAFLAFLEGRPESERWELVGGMPLMMTPPRIAHQRIASNIERALNAAIEVSGLDRRADREIGLQIEGAPGYRPEPEIAVIDAEYDDDRYASRFYGVVEVLSQTDLARNPRTGRTAIDDKIAFYKSHPSAEFILILAQDRISADVHARATDGDWTPATSLASLDAMLTLPRLGPVCPLAEIYKGVRLDIER